MPKVKTNKAAAKRFRATSDGRFTRSKAYKRHLKSSKTSKRRRNLRKNGLVAAVDEVHIKRLLPYS